MLSTFNPNSYEPLSREAFFNLVDTVGARRDDPEPFRARLAEDADINACWDAFEQAHSQFAARFSDLARIYQIRGERALRREFSGSKARRRHEHLRRLRPDVDALHSRMLAFSLGEVAGLSRMSPDEMATEGRSRWGAVSGDTDLLGAEEALHLLYPALRTIDSALRGVRRQPVQNTEEGGLPVHRVLESVRQLESIQNALDPKANKIARTILGGRMVPAMAGSLGSAGVLHTSHLPEVLDEVYRRTWHTNPHTHTATGGFASGVGSHLRHHGNPEHLIVAAGVSDGSRREDAAASENTPVEVWEMLMYDNRLSVLREFVQHPRFNNEYGRKMIDTGLAPQITAVMNWSFAGGGRRRVDLSIRHAACDRAIQHPGVDPLDIYRHLQAHRAVCPPYLWPAFIRASHDRLEAARMHEDPRVAADVERKIARFSSAFVKDVVLPYWKVSQAARSDPRRPQQYERYLQTLDYIKDEKLMGLVVEVCEDEQGLIDLLRYTVQSEIPITPNLMVKVFRHPSEKVRAAGMELIPSMNRDTVDQAERDLESMVEEDRGRLRDDVANLIPDYTPLDGEARVLSRNRHFFLAADELPREDIEDVFLHCAREDPRRIPERFREAVSLRRSRLRFEKMEADVVESWTPPAESGMVVQSDLFGAPRAEHTPAVSRQR